LIKTSLEAFEDKNQGAGMQIQRESSVMFNLAELMQLESERVSAEQESARVTAQRAAQAQDEMRRTEREMAERVAAQAAQQAQASLHEAQRLEAEREACLLRVRMQVQAQQRAADEQAQRHHARLLHQIDAQHGAVRAARTHRTIVLVIVACGLGGYFGFIEPAVRASRADAMFARREAAANRAESAALRRQLTDAHAARIAHASPTNALTARPRVDAPATPNTPRALGRPKKSTRTANLGVHQAASDPGVLGGFDDVSDDPLGGLPETDMAVRHF
jgi:hypothetical protein